MPKPKPKPKPAAAPAPAPAEPKISKAVQEMTENPVPDNACHGETWGFNARRINEALRAIPDSDEQRRLLGKWMRKNKKVYIVGQYKRQTTNRRYAKDLWKKLDDMGNPRLLDQGDAFTWERIYSESDAYGWTFSSERAHSVHVVVDRKRTRWRHQKITADLGAEAGEQAHKNIGNLLARATNKELPPDVAKTMPEFNYDMAGTGVAKSWFSTTEAQLAMRNITQAADYTNGQAAYLSTTLHELGHRVQFDLAGASRGQPYWRWKLPVYKQFKKTTFFHYARTNKKEWFAEAFAAWMQNRAAVRAIDPDLDEWLLMALKKAAGEKYDYSRWKELTKRMGMDAASKSFEREGKEAADLYRQFWYLLQAKPQGWQQAARDVYALATPEVQHHIRLSQEAWIVDGQEDEWPLK